MNKFMLFVFFLMSSPALATEVPQYEFTFRPYLGYSNYSGVSAGGIFGIGLKISDHWQWHLGGDYVFKSKRDDRGSFITGPRYNFGDDFSRAWFAGLYVEYGNDFYCCGSKPTLSGMLELGRRFRINDSGTWTYQPTMSIGSNGDSTYVSINPLAFGFSF